MTLEEIRLNNGWCLEDLSCACGIDIETLFKIENRLETPSKWTIDNILSVLELEYDDIIFTL